MLCIGGTKFYINIMTNIIKKPDLLFLTKGNFKYRTSLKYFKKIYSYLANKKISKQTHLEVPTNRASKIVSLKLLVASQTTL